MGKATREANKGRMEAIEQHVAWATLQDPIVRALATYSSGCRVYGPTPEGEWKPGFVYYPMTKAVLVPDVCDKQVVIPAGHRRVIAGPDHGKVIAVVLGDPNDEGIANRYMLELAEGLELTLPGGKIAKLVKQSTGGYALEEPDEGEPAAALGKKPGRRPGRKPAED